VTAPAADWPCEAYGPEGLEHGARCFFSPDLGARDCIDPEDCHARMTDERRRVFSRISELAAAGDPVALQLAEDFTSPDQLLGGEEDR
jgi:hypothetical protein